MISNQILQNTIDGMKGITRVDLCIMDTEGNYVRDFINCTESEIPNTYLHW